MNLFNNLWTLIISIINIIAVGVYLYYLFLAVFSFFVKKRKLKEFGNRKFAIVIPAHNESQVVGEGIDSIKHMNYPEELYDIYVIADNCTDSTSEVARSRGAKVMERTDPKFGGKGYALKWFFTILLQMDEDYRSVVILDADNIVHPDFLAKINNKMNQGYKIVQGYLDSKNPFDSAITGYNSIEFWVSNRMLKLSRDNLGLSAQLGGTGFSVDTDILREYGWDATCLTEDLEFTCKLVLNGHKVGWEHEAIIYDEKPLTLKASWIQRKRWMQGFADVFTQYFFPLMKKGITKGSFIMIDCAIYSIQPILLILTGISALYGIVHGLYYLSDTLAQMPILHLGQPMSPSDLGSVVVQIAQVLLSPVMMLIDKKLSLKSMLAYITCPVYLVTWMPLAVMGILHKNKKEWAHTEHTRAIKIHDIDQK